MNMLRFPDGMARNLWALLLMVLAAVGAQFEFSWMGFSPTDEGWILAYSRRILAGQVPQRDYLRVQVPGTELFHAPEVLFGGDYTFWISRFVAWIQIAVIAWAWPMILSKLSGRNLSWHRRACLGLICFAFTANTFPVIVWPTYDGLFLISIGLLLVLRRSSFSELCGYFLIGLAYMCKQNFIVVFPCVLLILGDWKKTRNWIAAALPGILYVLAMFALRALPDVLIQVGSATPFIQRAILPVVSRWNVLIGIGLGLGFTTIDRVIRRRYGVTFLAPISIFVVVALCGIAIDSELSWYSDILCWPIFGFCLGAVLSQLFSGGEHSVTRAGFLALVTAWSTAISTGFNFPTLGCGVLAIFLLESMLNNSKKTTKSPYAWGATVALTTIVLAGFYAGRHKHIYRDLAADQLTARLDGVLPGGRLLRTNSNTYAFLSDLNNAIDQTHGERFAIIPGFPAYWVKGKQLDPLPLDWPFIEVLSNPKMTDRLVKSLADEKGNVVLLVEKVEPTSLKDGFKPLDEPIYPEALLSYARTHFKKVGETKYFEIRK